MARMLIRTSLTATLLATAAAAQPAPTRLSYAAYVGGVEVVDMQAELALTPLAYRLQLAFQLVGAPGALFHAEGTSVVDGRFLGAAAVPRQLVSNGFWRGQARVTQVDWQGGLPVVTRKSPPDEDEREPVPAELQRNTIDTISAVALLLRHIGATNRCEGPMTTFDGRRLSAMDAHTEGEDVLPPTSRSSFAGPALRCDVEGRLIGGFATQGDRDAMRKPHHGTAWFARLTPGGPPVPVRMTFEAGAFGTATMYLTQNGARE